MGYQIGGLSFIGAEPRPEIPQEVTMRQARLALLHSGYLEIVNTAVEAMPGLQGDVARIEWNYSKGVERHKALVVALTAGFGWSEEFVDNLFKLAITFD